MRILNLGYSDTGGCGWRTQQALNGHNGITYDVAVGRQTWIRYPTTPQRWEDRHTLAELADIHHARNTLKVLDGLPKRPTVIHYHGTQYRDNPHDANKAAANYGAQTLVSTVDLLEHAPHDAIWYGGPYNIPWLAKHRRHTPGPLRVGHAPTVRTSKGTDQFLTSLATYQNNRGRGVDNHVRVILIERKPWLQALKIKGTCDVLFDQYTLGYGGNAVEAWAMGIPVISGAPQHILDRMLDMWGYLPFYPATPDTITDAIDHMRDPDVRQEWAQRGLDHVQRYYTPEHARTLLTDVYAQTLSR